jgi:Associated with zinc fingers
MSDPGPAPADVREPPADETSIAAPTAAIDAWKQVRRRTIRMGPSATFNPRSVAAIPLKGKKRLSPDEARTLIATVRKASKLTVMGENEESVEALLIQAAAIGKASPSPSLTDTASPSSFVTGKASPSPFVTGKASPSLHVFGKASPSPSVTGPAAPAHVTPMDVGSSPSPTTSQSVVPPTKKRQIPQITGFFPESFNHLIFARKLTGMLNTPPILARRGIEKRGPEGALITKVRVSIQTTNESDFLTTTQLLKTEGIESFVYRTLSDRTVKVVIRNLMESTPPEEVQAELVSLGYEVVNVAAMRNFRKIPIPMFLAELRDTATTPEIYNLRTLLHMRVKVEAYRGPSGPRQCHNCCRFGHVTSGCAAHPRCVKCAGAHHTSSCPKLDPAILPTCVNCNERHTASYRACPAFKAAFAAHKSRVQGPKPQPAPVKAPAKFVPAPIPARNAWDRPIQIQAQPIPAVEEAPVAEPAAAKPRPAPRHAQAVTQARVQAPKPQRERPAKIQIPNPTQNTSFLRSADCESDVGPSDNQPSASAISSLIKRGLELLQMKLRSTSTSDSQALSMATLHFVVEAVQLLV